MNHQRWHLSLCIKRDPAALTMLHFVCTLVWTYVITNAICRYIKKCYVIHAIACLSQCYILFADWHESMLSRLWYPHIGVACLSVYDQKRQKCHPPACWDVTCTVTVTVTYTQCILFDTTNLLLAHMYTQEPQRAEAAAAAALEQRWTRQLAMPC